jgi:hypothetical protein
MMSHPLRHNRHVESDLHPVIYKTAAGLILWFGIAAWLLFASSDYQKFDLVMVSFVMLAAVAIPSIVLMTRRHFLRTHMHAEEPAPHSLHAWLAGDFQTWQARIPAGEAAVQILLPLAAVSIGLTALGIVRIVDIARIATS